MDQKTLQSDDIYHHGATVMGLSHETSGQSPHLTEEQVARKLAELESATGQQRFDLMTDLAWRPAWAIRSRRGVWRLLVQWYKCRRQVSAKTGDNIRS